MSDNDQLKNNNGVEPDEGSINLLPESLRQAENKELLAKDSSPTAELIVPKLDKNKLPEGKVPWFSFVSWFRKDKKSKGTDTTESTKNEAKPKLVFKILKNKEEQRAAELAKEESWKQEIIKDVFAKNGKSLPENDNALFNQEKKIDIPVTPAVTPKPISYEALKPILPTPPVVPEPTPPAVDMSLPLAPREPVSAPIPSAPAVMPVAENVESKPNKSSLHLPHWHLGGHTAVPEKDKKESGDGFQVNLMPTALTVKNWSQISQQLVISAVVALVVVGLAYGGLVLWGIQIEQQANKIDEQIKAVESSINNFQDLKDQIAVTETQIKDVQQLLNRHIYWTKFFVLLQKYTIDTVYFESFAAGINGSLSLNAHGNDYQAAARQLKLLQSDAAKEFVKDASITSVSKSATGGVNFSVSFTLNKALFYYATSTPTN